MPARTRPTFLNLMSNPPEPEGKKSWPDPTRPKFTFLANFHLKK
jgi:hypothetical protein